MLFIAAALKPIILRKNAFKLQTKPLIAVMHVMHVKMKKRLKGPNATQTCVSRFLMSALMRTQRIQLSAGKKQIQRLSVATTAWTVLLM
jgi:menaquinone-dependent protoporphyrinogen IX oxidase